MSTRPFVVRCFAIEDEALVDEWPVAIDEAAARAIAGARGDEEIHPIDHATAEKLIGRPIEPWSEPVEYFLEPAAVRRDAE